ncbi:MAG: virulence-associated E family protein [Roseobacter sp.]
MNPPREFLQSLRWDGIERLPSWLQTFVGAEESDYVTEVGLRFFVSLVARVLRPGCKSDECMVLEGGQGVGKSSLLRAIVGDEYFGDALPDIRTKDASIYIRGRWVVELSELSVLRRADFESVKSFISRQEELYRAPYARNAKSEPRMNVFAGTTNRSDYLGDPTGSRRFLPITVSRIDLPGICLAREQLFAEAVAAFNSGDQWWVKKELLENAALVQSERGEDDPWIAKVIEHCEGLEAVSCTSILTKTIKMDITQAGNRETKRIANILIAEGWQRDGKFTFGVDKGRARYVRLK